MSHIVAIQVEVKDFDAIKSACRRRNLKEPVHGRAEVFQTEIEGVIVELPEWIYPAVCVLHTDELKYDNFNQEWGDQKYLDQFVQTYCIEKATLEARRKGYSVVEQSLADGTGAEIDALKDTKAGKELVQRMLSLHEFLNETTPEPLVWNDVSRSRLNLWLRYPLVFRRRYIDGPESPSSPIIVDFKTTASASYCILQHEIQMSCYAYLVRAFYGYDESASRFGNSSRRRCRKS